MWTSLNGQGEQWACPALGSGSNGWQFTSGIALQWSKYKQLGAGHGVVWKGPLRC